MVHALAARSRDDPYIISLTNKAHITSVVARAWLAPQRPGSPRRERERGAKHHRRVLRPDPSHGHPDLEQTKASEFALALLQLSSPHVVNLCSSSLPRTCGPLCTRAPPLSLRSLTSAYPIGLVPASGWGGKAAPSLSSQPRLLIASSRGLSLIHI